MLFPRAADPCVNGALTDTASPESQMALSTNSSACCVVIDGPRHVYPSWCSRLIVEHRNLIDSANGLIQLNEPDLCVSSGKLTPVRGTLHLCHGPDRASYIKDVAESAAIAVVCQIQVCMGRRDQCVGVGPSTGAVIAAARCRVRVIFAGHDHEEAMSRNRRSWIDGQRSAAERSRGGAIHGLGHAVQIV